jgi:hypothetical protein
VRRSRWGHAVRPVGLDLIVLGPWHGYRRLAPCAPVSAAYRRFGAGVVQSATVYPTAN